MTKRKETSTNSINHQFLNEFCGVHYAIDLIEGRWKMIILYKLEGKVLRFTELKKLIPNITDRVLTRQLKELERDGLIARSVVAAVPAKVVYALTESGHALSPTWKRLEQWGLEHKAKMDSAQVIL